MTADRAQTHTSEMRQTSVLSIMDSVKVKMWKYADTTNVFSREMGKGCVDKW